MRFFLSFIIFYLITSLGYAWTPIAHMVIADIAYERLTPVVRNKIDQMVKNFSNDYPQYNSFSQLARWPDDIKRQNITIYSHWHYIDEPFSQDGTPLMALVDSDNIIWALKQMLPIIKNTQTNPYERARFLAFLIHCASDLHQPLHTVSRISKKYPFGDQGGNLLYIVNYPDAFHAISLHKLWDTGFDYFKTESIASLTDKITELYPEEYFGSDVNNVNFNDWKKEGYRLAISYVYTTPENKIPSSSYINRGRLLAEQRAALAGYRLAYLLNHLLE